MMLPERLLEAEIDEFLTEDSPGIRLSGGIGPLWQQ